MMRRRAGFTLLEVMVATTIMAIAVTGLLSGLYTSMRNAARVTEYDRASQLAKRKMDELMVLTRLPRNTTLQGGFAEGETGGVAYHWRAQIRPYEVPPNPQPLTPVLDRIDLEVSWPNGDHAKTFTIEGYRTYMPPPPPPGATQ